MSRHRRRFTRPTATRRYKKLFVLATEGEVTEPQYFALLNDLIPNIHIKTLNSRHASSPHRILNLLVEYLQKEQLLLTDEAWLVADKDSWPDQDINKLFTWSNSDDRYGVAISYPCFEVWLLLHFENAKAIASAKDCIARLKKHWPNFNKSIPNRAFSISQVKAAVQNAKAKHDGDQHWLLVNGQTTVYQLVEKMLDA